jgi:hypothetical protein
MIRQIRYCYMHLPMDRYGGFDATHYEDNSGRTTSQGIVRVNLLSLTGAHQDKISLDS